MGGDAGEYVGEGGDSVGGDGGDGGVAGSLKGEEWCSGMGGGSGGSGISIGASQDPKDKLGDKGCWGCGWSEGIVRGLRNVGSDAAKNTGCKLVECWCGTRISTSSKSFSSWMRGVTGGVGETEDECCLLEGVGEMKGVCCLVEGVGETEGE